MEATEAAEAEEAKKQKKKQPFLQIYMQQPDP